MAVLSNGSALEQRTINGASYDINLHNGVELLISFLCPRHSKNGRGALSVTPVRACIRPSVRFQNLVFAQ